MPLLSTALFLPPSDDKEFEIIIRDLFAAHWKDPNTQINGRSGQRQDGVDVYGKPAQGQEWYGLQCKLRSAKPLTRKEVETEVGLSHSFRHKLSCYIFATTQHRDTQLQKIIEEVDVEEWESRNCHVQIRFWEDICSLLSEHRTLIHKYYPQFFNHSTVSESSAENFRNEHSEVISIDSPMLLGVLVDLSRPLIKTVRNSTGISKDELQNIFNVLVEKASAYCRTPESTEVLPKLALFAYGYGLGHWRSSFNDLLLKIGFQSHSARDLALPSDPVRDLLAEVAAKQALPYTPTIDTLNQHWSAYKKSIASQFFDIGSGLPDLYLAMSAVHERMNRELQRSYSKYPLLIVISGGQVSAAEFENVLSVHDALKQLGIQIVHLYIGEKNITHPKTLYRDVDNQWPQEVRLLFELSSTVSDQNKTLKSIVNEAHSRGWKVPESAKLFFQINHSAMVSELFELLLNPLKDKPTQS